MEYFPKYHQNNIEKTILQTFLKLKKKKNLKSVYFNLSQNCLGLNVFRTNANYLKIFFFNLKNFNNTLKIFSSKVYYKSITKKQFKNIFITWGEKKNFEKNGNYNDNFFKISSQKKMIYF